MTAVRDAAGTLMLKKIGIFGASLLIVIGSFMFTSLIIDRGFQVRTGYNQLIPLFVTMTGRELFHARR